MYVMKGFFELFRKKTLIDRNAYLMTELIQDIDKVSLEVSVFKKKMLVEEFGNPIRFFNVG